MNTKNSQKEINVGVDTGKKYLDIHIRSLDIFFTVTNDKEGIDEAIKKIKKHPPTRIIIEATGRLEHAFIIACPYNDCHLFCLFCLSAPKNDLESTSID